LDWKDPNVTAPRTSSEEVYALIEADLLEAEAAGFPMTDATGLASQAAVKSLLAKVYLTMAGQPLNKGASYYQKAATKAKEVIDYATANPGKIALFTSYDDLHDASPAKENSLEHIFMVQYAAGIANTGFQDKFLPNNTNITASGEVGTTVPTASFLASYEPGDKRTLEKGFYFKEYFLGAGTGAPTTLNRSYVYKHFDVVANGKPGTPGTGNSGLNYPLIRYAEVLLIYAEAQNETGGLDATAHNALKAIRDRAGLVTPFIGAFTQATFRDAVLIERWHELSFEGITWFDMIRLRKVYDPATNTMVDFVGASLNGATLQAKHLLLPLPAADFRNNPNLQPNNPGW
jgi:starch-binding outer membrane protein, SusD/RagB family